MFLNVISFKLILALRVQNQLLCIYLYQKNKGRKKNQASAACTSAFSFFFPLTN